MAPPPADVAAAASPTAAPPPTRRPSGRPGVRLDPALRKRIAAGAFMGLFATGDVLLGGWFFALLLLGAVTLMAREWAGLAGPLAPIARDLVLGAALIPAAAIILVMAGERSAALLLLGVGSVAAAGFAAFLPGSPSHWAAGGVLYGGLPALSLLWLRNDGPYGTELVLWLFFVVWSTDTFAYFSGRAIGGPRLAPRLSPSKTWAGLVGGVTGAAAVGATFAAFHGGLPVAAGAIAGLLAVVAQGGDLFESWLKRRAGLKDSGTLIPGHGGVFDRLDGLLFAAPAFAAIVIVADARGGGAAP